MPARPRERHDHAAIATGAHPDAWSPPDGVFRDGPADRAAHAAAARSIAAEGRGSRARLPWICAELDDDVWDGAIAKRAASAMAEPARLAARGKQAGRTTVMTADGAMSWFQGKRDAGSPEIVDAFLGAAIGQDPIMGHHAIWIGGRQHAARDAVIAGVAGPGVRLSDPESAMRLVAGISPAWAETMVERVAAGMPSLSVRACAIAAAAVDGPGWPAEAAMDAGDLRTAAAAITGGPVPEPTARRFRGALAAAMRDRTLPASELGDILAMRADTHASHPAALVAALDLADAGHAGAAGRVAADTAATSGVTAFAMRPMCPGMSVETRTRLTLAWLKHASPASINGDTVECGVRLLLSGQAERVAMVGGPAGVAAIVDPLLALASRGGDDDWRLRPIRTAIAEAVRLDRLWTTEPSRHPGYVREAAIMVPLAAVADAAGWTPLHHG